MPFALFQPELLAPAPAVLLVLLPDRWAGQASQAVTDARLADLQHLLGPAVRVLRIDEASHPAVVHSFAPAQLPACVLVRQGVELWRQQGLPEGDALAATLLAAAQA